MSGNLQTPCLVVFAAEHFVIGSCSHRVWSRGQCPLRPRLSPLWHWPLVLVPVLIRKQQIGANALMNATRYCSGLMKQSGSEMCTLISCLQGWVGKKGHFPTVCGSALHEFNQAHPWPMDQAHQDNYWGLSLLFNHLCPLRNSSERTHQASCFHGFPPLSLQSLEALNGLRLFCFLPSNE